ncbi:hypothetical protein ACFFWD_15455 [Bradyrhizobium erythrophlei]|uniref:hypothetical protein n=1 Tax=Bradyrhizobium erythrophlei TaxID=1437360 RepID=UPI0035E5E801
MSDDAPLSLKPWLAISIDQVQAMAMQGPWRNCRTSTEGAALRRCPGALTARRAGSTDVSMKQPIRIVWWLAS